MDVSILTVTWNSAEYVADQIASAREAAAGLQFEQLIADNFSSDETASITRNKFPDLFLLTYGENKGFGFANNELAKKAKGKYFLLLNPDMKLFPGSLAPLIAWADTHPRAGIIGCKLVDESGDFNRKTSPRHFPTLFSQLAILLKLPHIFPGLLDHYLWRNFDSEREQLVDSVQGGMMLVRRELYDSLGRLFDPRYFIWFEDVDLCREAKEKGFEVWYTPVVSAIDFSGRSFRKRSFMWKQKNFIISMFRYFYKWGIWRS